MTIDNLTWILTVGSLIGGQLVIGKNKTGYIIWVFINALWLGYFTYKSLYASSFLFLVYLIQAIYGYFKWNKNDNN